MNFELDDCPKCGGTGLLEQEGNSGMHVYCVDCGAYTVVVDYKSEDDKEKAAQKVADLWNEGKVIGCDPGE